MDAGDPSIDALLAAAGVEFAEALPAKVTALAGLIAGAAWKDARRAAHKLRGSAATYGHAELGASAGAIEEALLEAGDAPSTESRQRIDRHLVSAQAQAARAAREAR
jgi:HPt (histidine-containing phosphotransfer) domain-containing protein